MTMLVLAFAFTGCGTTEPDVTVVTPGVAPATATPAPGAQAAPAPEVFVYPDLVHVALWAPGGVPAQSEMDFVLEHLNAITIPEFNIEVNFRLFDVATYRDTMAPMIAAGEDICLINTFPAGAAHFNNLAAQGMLIPLDDLLPMYGQDILDIAVPERWEATTRDGQILAVPRFIHVASDMNVMFVREWFEETGYSPEDIRTMDDVDRVVRAFHANHPDLLAFSSDTRALDFAHPAGFGLMYGVYFDNLGNTSGVSTIVEFTADGQTDWRVVNRYTTQEFQSMRELFRRWYVDGLVDRDAPLVVGRGFPLIANDRVFAAVSAADPMGQAIRNTQTIHPDPIVITLKPGVEKTGSILGQTYAIPVSASNPAASMRLLNAMYSDPRVANLMAFGVEGYHYIMNADGQMEFPPGMTMADSPFHPNNSRLFPNVTLMQTWAGTDPALVAQEPDLIRNAVRSPLMGFSIDASGVVGDILAQIDIIARDEFNPFIMTGAASDAIYYEFIDRLYDAGLETLIEEVQRQLDEWRVGR